jgi:glycosyltransferase involved in cell wall biosynthesis
MSLKLAYLVTHPIQYQAPLLRRVAAVPGLEFKAFFGSDFSARAFVDPDFGREIQWDVPLLEGYASEVLGQWGSPLGPNEIPTVWRPFSTGLAQKLRAGKFDVLWIHGYNRASHWVAAMTAKAMGIKVLMRDESTDISAERSPVKQIAKQLFFNGINKFVDRWLTIGSLNADYYRGFHIAPHKLVSVPYTVDNAYFQSKIAALAPQRELLRVRLGLEPGRPIILFAAKLIDRKQPLPLLGAFAELVQDDDARKPYLIYAGDGPQRGALEKTIAVSGLSASVKVLGFKSQAELAALYDLCDIFVLPSEREAWGLVVNEAMNAGRAIVCSDRIGCAPDLVVPGVNGHIYPFGNGKALTAALRDCLTDAERLEAMGKASLAQVNAWSFDQDIDGLCRALREVTGVEIRPKETQPKETQPRETQP